MTEMQEWFVAGVGRGSQVDTTTYEPSHIHVPRRRTTSEPRAHSLAPALDAA